MSEKKYPLVVLCGRTNVGKSTLFNCFREKHQALVSDIAGTTRDSNRGSVEWAGQIFELVDTAGILDEKYLSSKSSNQDDIDSRTQKQARQYLKEADLILFIVDNKAGLTPTDKALALALKKRGEWKKKLILVANKVDNFKQSSEAAEFNRLGLGEPYCVSGASGMSTGDLLDVIVSRISKVSSLENAPEDNSDKRIDVCIIGKPNVGKSSLLNAILGYERVIVSATPHTTREPQNTEINYQNRRINIIDTAGISKQGKKSKGLEKLGIDKTLNVLSRADIALLVLDISEPMAHQDAKLVEEIFDRQKSLIIIANKWDMVEERNTKKWTEAVYTRLPFATWAPVQFISAKNNLKVDKILGLILKVADERQVELSDSQAEKFLKQVVKLHKPAKGKGVKSPRIWEFKQTKNNPPAFMVRIGQSDDLHFSYLRFLENRLRERFGFTGTPIKIKLIKAKKSHTTIQPLA